MEKKLDLRIEKTYLLLHNAFTSLLEEKRFEEITVNELCERAMIRRTTFYKHFADKYEYFTFYLNEICDTFRAELPPSVREGSFSTCFLHMNHSLIDFLEQHEKLVQNMVNSNLFPMLSEILSHLISDNVMQMFRGSHISSKHPADTVLLERISDFYAGGILMMLLRELNRGRSIDEGSLFEALNLLAKNGDRMLEEVAKR